MAVGLKGWIVLAVLLLSGVGIWLLPAGRTHLSKRKLPTEAHRQWAELDAELKKEAWTYQHIQWRDSLVAELRVAESSGHTIVLGTPAGTADSLKARLERAVDLHLRLLGAEDPAMPLGVFFIPRTQFLPPDLSAQYGSRGGSREYYVSRGEEDPYCIIGVPYQDDFDGNLPSWSTEPLTRKIRNFADLPADEGDPVRTLGLCRHFAQHGAPGRGIYSWLEEGAFRFSNGIPDGALFLYFPADRPSRGPFGALTFLSRPLTPKGLACLQGVPDACLEAVLEPELIGNPTETANRYVPELRSFVAESPVDFHQTPWSIQYQFGPFETYLFSALEEEFGSDRFGRFWRSQEGPEVAFREAFGQPMDEWVMAWIRGYLWTAPRGPGVPFQATILTFLTLGILAGGAIRMARR